MTHQPVKIAQTVTIPVATIPCRAGCDLFVDKRDHIRSIGWSDAPLVVHLRSWQQAHVEPLPSWVERVTITIFADGGRSTTTVLSR